MLRKYDCWLSQADRYTAESQTRLWKAYDAIIEECRALRFPWEEPPKADLAASKDKLRSGWIKKFGDPSDPETAKKIQATVDFLNGQNLALRTTP